MRYALILVVLLCSTLLSCSDDTLRQATTPEISGDAEATAHSGVGIPFKGHWETTFTPPGDPVDGCDGNPETGVFVITATGVGTHLGRSTGVSESESDFMTQCGHSVTTAANGDVVEFDFEGTIDDSGFPYISFTGDFTFTGGTGRFEDATGGGIYYGTGNFATGEGEVTNIGTIDF